MRIVLTTHQFVPTYSAGTEILTYRSAKSLQARGHEVEVWAGHRIEVHDPAAGPDAESVTSRPTATFAPAPKVADSAAMPNEAGPPLQALESAGGTGKEPERAW